MRADLLVAKSLEISRNQALNLIKNGKIKFDDIIIKKPSASINEDAKIICDEKIYVGRGALKLKGFLEFIKLDLEGKRALDIGSSTGGFAQILLEFGVKNLSCVDVGSNQLASIIRENPKVEVYENTDIRDFEASPFDVVTADVSFIPLELILPKINILAKNDIILLFKPQFEVGPNVKRTSKGAIKNEKFSKLAEENFKKACSSFGWELLASRDCVITGKDGNQERFYHYAKK